MSQYFIVYPDAANTDGCNGWPRLDAYSKKRIPRTDVYGSRGLPHLFSTDERPPPSSLSGTSESRVGASAALLLTPELEAPPPWVAFHFWDCRDHHWQKWNVGLKGQVTVM